jgi:hypothetical protein
MHGTVEDHLRDLVRVVYGWHGLGRVAFFSVGVIEKGRRIRLSPLP